MIRNKYGVSPVFACFLPGSGRNNGSGSSAIKCQAALSLGLLNDQDFARQKLRRLNDVRLVRYPCN